MLLLIVLRQEFSLLAKLGVGVRVFTESFNWEERSGSTIHYLIRHHSRQFLLKFGNPSPDNYKITGT